MAHTTYADSEIEIRADFAQASSVISYRVINGNEDDPFIGTPFQVADASHHPDKALRLVNEWLDQQS